MSEPLVKDILEAAAEALGYHLKSHRQLSEAVSGDGLVSSYEVDLADEAGEASHAILYLETTQGSDERDGVMVFRNEDTDDTVAVWVYPQDPELPALPTAVYPEAAAVILEKMEIDSTGLGLRLVAYRPGKRAVVRIDTDRARIYMKVVRPTQVKTLQDLYRLWEDANLPVPATLGWTEEGLIGFASLPGVPALDVITDLDDAFLEDLERLIGQYASIESTGKARTSLASRVNWYARRVSARQPQLAERAHSLAARIHSVLESVGKPDSVTIHGDLHLGQVFVNPADPRAITGVLDIDTAGLGDPADDAGALYAHLIVSSQFEERRAKSGEAGSPDRGIRFASLAEAWRVRWARRDGEDPSFATRARAVAATHLLAHTLGGFADAERLIAHAERLLAEDEKLLI